MEARRATRRTRRASSARTRWAPARRVDVWVHKGAGAYICGEETALMNSLEGTRGNPRIKPPFPAVAGVFGQPTTINNVETLAAVPHILEQRRRVVQEDSARPDNPKSTGTKLWSVCGNVMRPGNYEVAMGFPFKDFLYDLCGGPLPGRQVQGGHPRRHRRCRSSDMEEAEAALDGLRGHGRRRARCSAPAACIVIDDAQCMVKQIARARALLRARELRAVHAVPRRHRVDDQDPRAHRRRRRARMEDLDTLLEIGDEHDRQDDLRAERLVRGAGRVAACRSSAARVRGAHHSKKTRAHCVPAHGAPDG